MLYVYYSEKSLIAETSAQTYCELRKGKFLKDYSMISSAMLNPLTEVVMIMGSQDTAIIDSLKASRLKRRISMITRDVDAIKEVVSKIVTISVLDDTTEYLPDLWDNPVVSYQNMALLKKHNKRPMYFAITTVKSSTLKIFDIVTETVDEDTFIYGCLKNISTKEGIKEFKQEVTDQEKKLNAVLTNKRKDDAKTFKDIKANKTEQGVMVYKDILEYIIKNKYATPAQVESAKELSLSRESGMSVEQALCQQGTISLEDLVVILRGYLNEQVIGVTELQTYVVDYKQVSQKLKSDGVIEAYAPEDTEHTSPIIVISYDKKDSLKETINKTINYSRLVLTLPEYIGGVISESAH